MYLQGMIKNIFGIASSSFVTETITFPGQSHYSEVASYLSYLKIIGNHICFTSTESLFYLNSYLSEQFISLSPTSKARPGPVAFRVLLTIAFSKSRRLGADVSAYLWVKSGFSDSLVNKQTAS